MGMNTVGSKVDSVWRFILGLPSSLEGGEARREMRGSAKSQSLGSGGAGVGQVSRAIAGGRDSATCPLGQDILQGGGKRDRGTRKADPRQERSFPRPPTTFPLGPAPALSEFVEAPDIGFLLALLISG